MTIELHDRLKVAVASEVSESTVASYLAGRVVRPMSRIRIERGLVALGWTHLIRADGRCPGSSRTPTMAAASTIAGTPTGGGDDAKARSLEARGVVSVTIYMPRELRRRLKTAAMDAEVPVSRVVIDAVEAHLRRARG